jgi:Nuclease-related domain
MKKLLSIKITQASIFIALALLFIVGLAIESADEYAHQIGLTDKGIKVLLVLFIIFLLGACLAYKGFNKNKNKKQALIESCASDEAAMIEIKNKGKKGESAVNAVINELRHCMDFINIAKTWMPSDDGIEDIVIDNGSMSQEIDSLLVTGDKVFVIEVKDWKGEISVKDGVPFIDGTKFDRQEPLLQTKPKVKNLERLINYQEIEGKRNQFEDIGIAKILPIYVFSHPLAKLDPNLPHNYVTLAALPSLIGFYRDHYQESSVNNSKNIASMIKSVLDVSQDAKTKHMLRLATVKNPAPDIIEFKNIYDTNEKNKSKIALIEDGFKVRVKNAGLGLMMMLPFIVLLALALNH